MMENNLPQRLDEILAELRPYEQRGLDTSSLKIFIKNLKRFLSLLDRETPLFSDVTFEDKLEIIRSFLSDKRAFPRITDVIRFANERLGLEFRDQKESREVTIQRIVGRIASKPELKDTLKIAVISLRNEMVHFGTASKSRKSLVTAESFTRWAEIIKNI